MKESTTNKEASDIYSEIDLVKYDKTDIYLLTQPKKHISFRINERYESSYINVCDIKKRGRGPKYSNFPTIYMSNKHLIDLAKVILETLEPEALVETQNNSVRESARSLSVLLTGVIGE